MRIPWLSILITAVIVYVAATRLNWGALWDAFFIIDINYLLLSLACWGGMMIAKAGKWRLILHAFNHRISWMESARVLWIGLFVGIMTPGRIGDLVRIAYIHPPLSAGTSLLAVVIDRMYDIIILVCFAVAGLFYLSASQNITLISTSTIILLLLVVAAGTMVLFSRKLSRRILYPIIQTIIPNTWREVAKKHGNDFYDSIPLALKNSSAILLAGGVNVISMIFSMGVGYYLLLAVGANVDWGAAFLIVPIIALLEIVPFGVAGVGTREAASVIVLGAYAVSPEIAVLFSLTHFAVGYLPSFIAGGILFSRHPPKIDDRLREKIPFMKKKN